MITRIEEIHEGDGDDGFCGLMGWHLYGNIDALDVEMFMGDEDVMDQFPDGECWEVTEQYVRKVPTRDGGYLYAYSGPGPGASKVARVQKWWQWEHFCVNHVYEPANVGVPVEQVAKPPWPMVVRGMVYLCPECSASFRTRRDAAIKARLAETRASA